MGLRALLSGRKPGTWDFTHGRPRTILKDFLYVDWPRVQDALTSVQGGEVKEVVQRISRGTKGGAKVGMKHVFEAGASLELDRRSDAEIHLEQTAHSALSHLLGALEASRKGHAEECYLWMGRLFFVPCKAEGESINPHSSWLDRLWCSLWPRAARRAQEAREEDRLVSMGIGQRFTCGIELEGDQESGVVLAPAPRQWLACVTEELPWWEARNVTIVGKRVADFEEGVTLRTSDDGSVECCRGRCTEAAGELSTSDGKLALTNLRSDPSETPEAETGHESQPVDRTSNATTTYQDKPASREEVPPPKPLSLAADGAGQTLSGGAEYALGCKCIVVRPLCIYA